MKARIERISLPEPAQLRRLIAERADGICPGAKLVDEDAQGPTGVDVILVDEDGRPVFVDVVPDGPEMIPTRIFEHVSWFEQNKRLFLRAYSREGAVRAEDPVFAFVASRFPGPVLAAVAAMVDMPVRLLRAEYFLVDGTAEMLFEDVTPVRRERVDSAVSRRSTELQGGGSARPQNRIESAPVRTLLALFKSGVDGLDGRIEATESDEKILFTFGGRSLAQVAVSPGSFTVAPGDGLINPIVVSDRVSLERALNSVVSLFVREESGRAGGNGGGTTADLPDDEREELAGIWGTGVLQGEG